ncbi:MULTISPECIES: hypothetical protein [Burkholderia]|uniref:hypothetical protein n=1 Tax=Burkholderia TaxID=32008 RepID=UPI0012B25EF9|nr:MULTISPECIES: hypothetical protein [Burkholderia]
MKKTGSAVLKDGAKFVGAFLVGVAATAFARWAPNSSSDWAAWVQAFGTIAAIVASAALLHHQAGLQRRSRLRAIRAIVDLAVRSVTRRLDISEDFQDMFDLFASLNAKEVSFAFEALCKIPLHEIDSADAVLAVGLAIETMRRIVAKLESPDVVGKHREDERVVVANLFAEEVKTLRATYDALGNAV